MQTARTTFFVLFLICILGGPEAAPPRDCGEKWTPFNGKCYQFRHSSYIFRSALVTCNWSGGNVLEIESKSEELWIDLQSRLMGYRDGVWLGYSDIQKEGEFVALSDGKRPRYVNWAQGTPNNGQGGTEHCAMYSISRKVWDDERCSAKLNICQYGDRYGWIYFNGKCYNFDRSIVNIRTALALCYERGGKLLEIENKTEELWIDLQIRLLGYSHGVWRGFSDIQKEGEFLALSDRKRPRYVNRMHGAPNNGQGGTEHSAMYWIARKGWNDERCSIRLNYVCTK